MEQEDIDFVEELLGKASWLFYGDLDEYFDDFVKKVFSHELKDWGFGDVKMEPDFATAYWLFLSELERLNLVEYGTSPMGAWLTPDGERFKKIIMENENAISKVNEHIYERFNT